MGKLKPYVVSYELGGKHYGLTIMAVSAKVAKRHLKAIGKTGKVEGKLLRVV